MSVPHEGGLGTCDEPALTTLPCSAFHALVYRSCARESSPCVATRLEQQFFEKWSGAWLYDPNAGQRAGQRVGQRIRHSMGLAQSRRNPLAHHRGGTPCLAYRQLLYASLCSRCSIWHEYVASRSSVSSVRRSYADSRSQNGLRFTDRKTDRVTNRKTNQTCFERRRQRAIQRCGACSCWRSREYRTVDRANHLCKRSRTRHTQRPRARNAHVVASWSLPRTMDSQCLDRRRLRRD